uniref:Uncharacterized protein n=1 Tax=Anguilla anguilla TaxID=7936 RepID=A0A0E9VZH3_ANGAN
MANHCCMTTVISINITSQSFEMNLTFHSLKEQGTQHSLCLHLQRK